MNKRILFSMFPIYFMVLIILIFAAIGGSKAVTTYSQNMQAKERTCVIIDAGHGGEDGGAVSVTGKFESHINLDVALKTNDLMNLLGIKTKMIRTDDRSVYASGNTLSQKKISDLKERVKIVNQSNNCLLISIHQNYFTNEKYYGFQAFYPNTANSDILANEMQANSKILTGNNNRKPKPVKGVYLMDHINCTAVLIECGFLSNYREESLLQNKQYQQKIATVIAGTISNYLDRMFDS